MMDGIAFHTPDEDGNAPLICRRIALPSFLWPHFNGAFGALIEETNWYQFGDMPIEDVVQAFMDAYDNMIEGCMLGSVVSFAVDKLPKNVLLCDGSNYPKWDYPELWDVLHPSLKQTGIDRFNVPDLRQRFVIGEEEKVNAMFDVGLKAEIAHADNDMPKPYVLRYGIIAK